MKANAKVLGALLVMLMLFGVIPQTAVFANDTVSGSDVWDAVTAVVEERILQTVSASDICEDASVAVEGNMIQTVSPSDTDTDLTITVDRNRMQKVPDHIVAVQDGIQLSVETDKESYASGQEINVTVTVMNTNDYVVNNAAVTVELPEELSLVSGELSISGLTLQPGDTYHRAMKAIKTAPNETTKGTEPTKSAEPTKPNWPSVPTKPVETTKEIESTKGTNPTKAVEPTKPAAPTKGTTSSKQLTPSRPTTLDNPTVSTKQTAPTKPTAPADLTDSDKPIGPDDPIAPDDPADADDPVDSDETFDPEKPMDSDEIMDPTETTLPTTPPTQITSDSSLVSNSDAADSKTFGMPVKAIVIALAAISAVAALALIAVRKHKTISKRAICIVLFVAIAFGMAPIDVLTAEKDASHNSASKADSTETAEINISAKKTFRVDGEEYAIRAVLTGVYQKAICKYSYREKEDGSIVLTGYNGSESSVTVPSAIDGKTVSEIGESAFAGLLCLKTVHVPEGILRIDDYAFECCSLLKKVYLPSSLEAIGDGAFSGCESLILADMQDGVESIGKGAFLYCVSLVQLELPEALKELGDFAFAGCESLFSVRFCGNSLHTLPDRVFYQCTSLNRLFVPEKITSIGKHAFSGCEAIENLYFSEQLTSLGTYAFDGCTRLTSLTFHYKTVPTGTFSGCYGLSSVSVQDGTVRIENGAFSSSAIADVDIPASVREIEPGAFAKMHGHVSLNEENRNYQLIDGSLYTADGKTLVAYFPSDPYAEEPQTEFTVPDGVETIAPYAIFETELTKVTLPSSLKRIEAYAFGGTNVENVAIPEGTAVDAKAFVDPGQESDTSHDSDEEELVLTPGSLAGDKNLFREEDYADYRQISNDEFNDWCDRYIAYNSERKTPLSLTTIPYIYRYKGEIVPHFMPMTAVYNRDPIMWARAEAFFGDDFEQMYLMMDHGLFTELRRGKMEEPLVLYSGLYDSQLMAAAKTDVVPTQQQLVDAIGSTFTDPIMISTTTDPGIAANFGDTLFIIYASPEAMESLGAICIDAVVRSQEKEILMNANARYRILDVGDMVIEQKLQWDPESTTVYRHYVKVELLKP